ncbi:MAG: response regulator [Chryseosolibacter sp.]
MINSSGASHNSRQAMPKTCLLVDDDEDDKEIFCMALTETDPSVRCITANDGIDALKMLKDPTFVPDYIFLDLNMPLMSGKECLIEIRKRPHLTEVPVIIYTTSASQKDIEDTMEAGASSFITKPAHISVLSEKLLEVLSSAG